MDDCIYAVQSLRELISNKVGHQYGFEFISVCSVRVSEFIDSSSASSTDKSFGG